jgi:hypothetical protein
MKPTLLRAPKLLVLGLILLSIVGFGSWTFFGPLPDPSQAGIRDLARWLLQRDLVNEPRKIQVSLVNRLQAELETDFDLPSRRRWSDSAHDQLLRNVVFLGKVWFQERCRQYQQLEKPARLAFLESQLNVVSHWSSLETRLLENQPSTSDSSASSSTVRLFKRIETWVEEAEGEQRQQLTQVIQDATLCSLATDDLAKQSMDVRRDLADRITSFLNSANNDVGSRLQLEPSHYKQLATNSLVLMEAWLINRAIEFQSLTSQEKEPYVTNQLNQMKQWKLDDLLAPAGEGQENKRQQSSLDSSVRLLSRIVPHLETWINRADPAQQESFRDLIQHFQAQLLKNQFRRTR